MDEGFLIRLMRDGSPLRLDHLSADGVILGNERDAWPRGLTLQFDANNPLTRLRMDQVRQVQGWGSGEFKLSLSLEDGALAVTGLNAGGLPAGRYWMRLRIGDLLLPAERIPVEVNNRRRTELTIEARSDPRQVEMLLRSRSVDPEIRRVLAETGSGLDGLSLLDWLHAPQPRPSRKACLLNLLARLRSISAMGQPLLAHLRRVTFADVDRCYAAVDAELAARLRALAGAPQRLFSLQTALLAPIHRRLLRHIEDVERDAGAFRLHSFRQAGQPSLQAVIAAPPGDERSRLFYADLDIDLGNPHNDLKGFFVHLGELLSPGRTDHLKLREKLAADPAIREFLYYRVIEE
jgi:hypothetical protein